MVALAVTAQQFSQRPSKMLGITDPVLALELDMAGAMILKQLKQKAEEETD